MPLGKNCAGILISPLHPYPQYESPQPQNCNSKVTLYQRSCAKSTEQVKENLLLTDLNFKFQRYLAYTCLSFLKINKLKLLSIHLIHRLGKDYT